MKIAMLLHKAKICFNIINRYKNWREIIFSFMQGKNPTKIIFRTGIQIEAPRNSTLLDIAGEIFFNRIYNPDYLPIKINDIVVDIGANIGVFALFAASQTKNNIYTFEPFLENFEFLNRNINRNSMKNVISYNIAVSDKLGSGELFISEISGGHLLFDCNIKGKLDRYIEVPTTTLQRFMDDLNLNCIDFLKLDCEGSEGSILASTPESYLKRIKKIALEFHDNVSLLKHEEILGLLANTGFVTSLRWDRISPFGYIYGYRS